jgi:hypothetical protein
MIIYKVLLPLQSSLDSIIVLGIVAVGGGGENQGGCNKWTSNNMKLIFS